MRRLLGVLCVVIALTALGATQKEHEKHFRAFLERIYANLDTYRSYNDSILKPLDRDTWVSLFDRRSRAFKRIYDDNQLIYYEMSNYLKGHADSNARYAGFCNAFFNYNRRGKGEPFLRAAMAQALLDHYEALRRQQYDVVVTLNYLYLQKALQQYNISRLGDSASLEAAWQAACNALEVTGGVTPASSADQRNARINAVNNMCAPQWLTTKHTDYGHYCLLADSLCHMLADTNMTHGVVASTLTSARRRCSQRDWHIIRSLYLLDSTSVPRDLAQKAIDKQIEVYRQGLDSLSPADFLRYHVLLEQQGRETAKEAWDLCKPHYDQFRQGHDNESYYRIHSLYPVINDLIYLNDISMMPPEEKHANAVWLSHCAVELFKNQIDDVRDHSFMLALGYFISYDRLLKHLSVDEKADLVHGLMMRTQICTYAHMRNVSNMADILIDGVRRYRPDLIPDIDLGCSPEAYAHTAALVHDWGKAQLAPVIANDFRRLNDNELRIIRQHPERGAKMLTMDPELAPYIDIALGHHRWYDGTGGYPQSFDNTASPVRFYIDLITICDCLEAGTDPIGRNYFLKKPFAQMVFEMRQQAGTRYNPELLELILQHSDIYKALRNAADNDRHSVYYEIYNLLHPASQK